MVGERQGRWDGIQLPVGIDQLGIQQPQPAAGHFAM